MNGIIVIVKHQHGKSLGELDRAESSHREVGRPYEPVWVMPVEGSGTSGRSRNTDAGITAFAFTTLEF